MTEILLTEEPDRDLFARIAAYLESDLKFVFGTKLSGTDQFYWNFKINNHPITLHLEHFSGIMISTSGSSPVSDETKTMMIFVADLIRNKFQLH